MDNSNFKQAHASPFPDAMDKDPAGRPRRLSRSWAIGAASKAASWTALFLFGQQALLIGFQATQELAARDSIAAMRAEQSWLVAQGLARPRAIGAFHPPLQGASAFASLRPMAGPWSAGWAAQAFGAPKTWVISAPTDAAGMAPAIYRHEEAHALAEEALLAPGMAASWPPLVAKAISAELGSIAASSSSAARRMPTPTAWRGAWLAQVRKEAFADAFACASIARRGQAALRECSMNLAARRTFPGPERLEPTSLEVAGSPHAVEMASFIAGQLDASNIASLSLKELMDLCGSIADDSLEWALARQAVSTGFFEGDGKAWWMEIAQRRGADAPDAAAAWESWRSQALSERPDAAFGSFHFAARGLLFEAQKLPSSGFSANWRFDGYRGQALLAGSFEAGHGGPLSTGVARIAVAADGSILKASDNASDPADEAARMGEALAGAAWTQWAMAKRLGAPMEKELDRMAALLPPDEARRASSLLPAFELDFLPDHAATPQSQPLAKKILHKRRGLDAPNASKPRGL